ncbi:hypothetical protein AB0I28_22760 [Phytomonospora sp. NPDC050363]|uniref:hypothetical protein n=1 Tax=Phytomonospora sp. NPDC050363 TaxID=3155642 RepID=UPI0033CFC4F6
MRAGVCSECGARDGHDALSVLCGRCGAPLGIPDSAPLTGGDFYLPPLLDRAQAVEALRDWIGSRRFAPGALKLVEGPEHLRLTMVPHWSVDARAVAAYQGERGESYTETETVKDSDGRRSTRTVTKTRWHEVSGEVESSFSDLLIVAAEPACRPRVAGLAPWPHDGARQVRTESPPEGQILARHVGPDDAFAEAKGLMNPEIQRACREAVGGDDQRVHRIETTYPTVARRSLSLPVWTAAYRHGGRAWHVLINGATGEVLGRRPYSAWKILATVGVAAAVVAAVIVAVTMG